uniref:Uncharacterized protein n=1 Tax=Romanomermis culicivorax TaxID=13658 RepID=A0A915J098_ROMCU
MSTGGMGICDKSQPSVVAAILGGGWCNAGELGKHAGKFYCLPQILRAASSAKTLSEKLIRLLFLRAFLNLSNKYFIQKEKCYENHRKILRELRLFKSSQHKNVSFTVKECGVAKNGCGAICIAGAALLDVQGA